jgi:uncharacterized SAM-binding protein YcdF (DUF218 family)
MALDATTRKPSRRLLLFLAVLGLALLAAIVILRNAGWWLVRQDPLAQADVIVVLSGGLPHRAEQAAKLFGLGYAPDVWVTYPVSPADELERIGVHFIGEEEYNREILVHEGVPPAAVRLLPDQILNTEQEVLEVSRELQRNRKTRAILITSPEHTRRVKTLWHKLAGKQQEAIVRAAENDSFDSAHWWRQTKDALAVVREYLGLLNAWTGLRVRPQ